MFYGIYMIFLWYLYDIIYDIYMIFFNDIYMILMWYFFWYLYDIFLW